MCHYETARLCSPPLTAWHTRGSGLPDGLCISSRFVWGGMTADINRCCRDCQHCSRGEVTRQPAAALVAIEVPTRWFSHMHIDLVGLLPMLAEGFNLMFHPLVGSRSAKKTRRRPPAPLRRGTHRWLGFPIWRAGDNKTRLLPSVFFCGLGHPLLLPGYPLHHNSSLPPPGQ
jgi:hypothetical protein